MGRTTYPDIQDRLSVDSRRTLPPLKGVSAVRPSERKVSVSSFPEGQRLPEWMSPRASCHRGCPWLDVAVGLTGLGYAVFPIGDGKRPLVKWGPFHVSAPTWGVLYNDWRNAWRDAAGVGLIAGRPHGLVIVDADDEASWTWALDNLPAVRGVKTRRGGHLHFAHPLRGIIGNRSGDRAVTPTAGVRFDVKGLAGYGVGPCSRHPSGHVYEPLGDWMRSVAELPMLPDVIAYQAEDKPPTPAPLSPRCRLASDPERAMAGYLAKVRRETGTAVPPEGQHSDDSVFHAASWAKANATGLSEQGFVAAIRAERPEFTEKWIAGKWRSATGRR